MLPTASAGDHAIVVTATGSAAPIVESGLPIAVIGDAEIARVQGPDLTRLLERVPGVSLTRNGGRGGFTGVRLRGSEAEQVLVLIDGVRVADVGSPGGGTDFGSLLTGGIGRIEVLRGPNSVVWGSQAIGGVIALTSRQIDGVEASAEYGGDDSVDAQANGGILRDGYALNVGAGFTRNDGISSASSGSERDGFRQYRASGKGSVNLAESLSLTAAARHARSRLEMDGYPPPTYAFADTPEYQTGRETSGRAGVEWRGDRFTLGAGYALSENRRRYYDAPGVAAPNFTTHGRSRRADLNGLWQPGNDVRVDFGADSEWTRFDTLFEAGGRARLSSAHVLAGRYGSDWTLAAGARIDDHSRFGSRVTLGANGAIALGGAWRLRASYGEGFKTPTLYQLLSNYGNAALKPERSRGFDIGVELADRNADGLHVALSAFRRDSRELIDFISCWGVTSPICTGRPYGTYDNVGKARAQGFEFEIGAKVSERFRAQAAYSYVDAKNRTPGAANRGNALARRPAHSLTLSTDWKSPVGVELGADLRLVSDSFDDAANTRRIDGHALATVRASLPLNDAFELFGRVENLTDARYESVSGYGVPGRAAYLGVRVRL